MMIVAHRPTVPNSIFINVHASPWLYNLFKKVNASEGNSNDDLAVFMAAPRPGNSPFLPFSHHSWFSFSLPYLSTPPSDLHPSSFHSLPNPSYNTPLARIMFVCLFFCGTGWKCFLFALLFLSPALFAPLPPLSLSDRSTSNRSQLVRD